MAKKNKNAKALWGGRFKKPAHPLLKDFSYSLAVDKELLEAEIEIDVAWAKMLGRIRLISKAESARLVRALVQTGKELAPKLTDDALDRQWLKDYEDIHTLVQMTLEKKVGGLGKKIHTGRSRNDLVVTSTRVYLRKKIAQALESVQSLQKGLVKAASNAGDSLVSGMTHLRKAQPVLVAHHLLAYVEMLEDDAGRLRDAQKRLDVMPLGSAALAGSALPLDQKFLARELGFSRIAPNSLAATSDRGFITETLAALSILWMHLSRLSEDFILWNSEPFGYIELDDQFATGSSLMPQKKNPDIFELTRGRSGVIFGYLQALLVIQKGLPLAYNRDLQEDKPQLFDALAKTVLTLELLALTVASVKFVPAALQRSVQDDAIFSTDILEYLVRKGMAFSEAHSLVGQMVAHASAEEKNLGELELQEFRSFTPVFDKDVYKIFDASVSVRSKKTVGSTHPANVSRELGRWATALGLRLKKK